MIESVKVFYNQVRGRWTTWGSVLFVFIFALVVIESRRGESRIAKVGEGVLAQTQLCETRPDLETREEYLRGGNGKVRESF